MKEHSIASPAASTTSLPAHARCRSDVFNALLSKAWPLPPDSAIQALAERARPDHPAVIPGRFRLEVQAGVRAFRTPEGVRFERTPCRIVEVDGRACRLALWPWRHDGARWVTRAALLRALPTWRTTSIDEALVRLAAERRVAVVAPFVFDVFDDDPLPCLDGAGQRARAYRLTTAAVAGVRHDG